MTDITTYTLIDHNGEPVESGLSAEAAAALILSDDGYLYEVAPDADHAGWWQLLVSRGSVNSPAGAGPMSVAYTGPSPYGEMIYVHAASEAEAWAQMAPMVLTADWRGMEAITDARYAAQQAELTAEEG